MLTVPQLKSLCSQMNIRPHRRKGQHFLVDSKIPQMMANAANLSPKDTVLEIGPGFGILTKALLEKAGKVVAVENDRRLVEYLKEKFAKEIVDGRLELIEGDILAFLSSRAKSREAGRSRGIPPLQSLETAGAAKGRPFDSPSIHSGSLRVTEGYKLVSNIPYSITSDILVKFIHQRACPRLLVLMVQKEVAERITAKPPRMSRLAVFVQFHAEVRRIATVPRTMFWPEPEVDSAIVLMRPYPVILSGAEGGVERSHHAHPRYKGRSFDSPDVRSGSLRMTEEARSFMCKLVAAGFAHPRKQLYRQIGHLLRPLTLGPLPQGERDTKKIIASCGISPTARPGELSIEQWIMLAQHRSH